MKSTRPRHLRSAHDSEAISRAEEDELERARTRLRRGKSKEHNAKPMTATDRAESVMSGTTALVGTAIAAFLFFAQPYLIPQEVYWLVCDVFLLFIPLMTIVLFFRADLQHFGMTRGDRKLGLKYAGIAIVAMIFVLVVVALLPEFRQHYGGMLTYPYELVGQPIILATRFSPMRIQPAALAYYEFNQGFYLFCWEFFYRGFLLFGLMRAKWINATGAIILQTIPFTLLHWSIVPSASKPLLEIVSAAFGGLILGWLAYKTRSFIYGFIIHWAIAVILDIFLIVALMVRPG